MAAGRWHHIWWNLLILIFVYQDSGNSQLALRPRRDADVRVVYFTLPSSGRTVLKAGPALFGVDLVGKQPFQGQIRMADPPLGCTSITNAGELRGKIAVVNRGDCMFIEKARNIQRTGAIAAIVIDHNPGISADMTSVFIMHHGYENDDITIPMVFLYATEGDILTNASRSHPDLIVSVADKVPSAVTENLEPSTKDYTEIPHHFFSTERVVVTTERLPIFVIPEATTLGNADEPFQETESVATVTASPAYFSETDVETVRSAEISTGRSEEHTGSGSQLSSGYIALIIAGVVLLVVIIVSVVSFYYFCPPGTTMSWMKLK